MEGCIQQPLLPEMSAPYIFRTGPFAVVPQEPVVEEQPYTLCASRSQPRLKTGEVAFECQYGTEAPVKVPLTAFFDAEGWCTDFEVCAAINNWCDKAYRYPETKRKCINCKCKATKGFVLCGKCDNVMGQMIYAQ